MRRKRQSVRDAIWEAALMADQVQAAQMMLSYKRGAISRDDVIGLLHSVCDMSPTEIEEALAFTDKMPVQFLQRQELAWFESRKKAKH